MIEGWAMAAAAVTAGAAVVGGAMQSRAAKKQSQFEAQASKEMVPLQGLEERRNLAYDYEYQDYMKQRERQRRAGAFAGLAKQFGGTGVAPSIEAVRPTDPNPTGGFGTETPPTAGSTAPAGLANAPELRQY